MKKQTKNLIFGVIILAGLLIYFGNFRELSLLNKDPSIFSPTFTTSIDNIQLQGNRNWSCPGADFIIDFYCDNGFIPDMTNEWSGNNPLRLSVSANDDTISVVNVQGTFPKGTLEVTCDLLSASSGSDPAYSYCSLNSITKSASATQSTLNGQDKKTEIITLNTDNTNVKIEARVDSSPLSFASSEVSIKFIPFVSPPISNGSNGTIGDGDSNGDLGGGNQEPSNLKMVFYIIGILALVVILFWMWRKTKR